jgi:hypothetical protein
VTIEDIETLLEETPLKCVELYVLENIIDTLLEEFDNFNRNYTRKVTAQQCAKIAEEYDGESNYGRVDVGGNIAEIICKEFKL